MLQELAEKMKQEEQPEPVAELPADAGFCESSPIRRNEPAL